MKLKDNTILITGGSSGIGLALAKKFVELGNRVIVTGRNAQRLEAAKTEVPELHTLRCDAADPAALKNLARMLEAEHPQLNVLVNNAGIMRFIDVSRAATDLAELTTELDINLAGPMRTVSVFIDTLKRNKGTILNVTSGLAFVPLSAAPIYCATKAALHSYTVSLRLQLKQCGVEVIELAPPAVQTNLASFPEGEVKVITTDELIQATFKGLRAGDLEIRPGQANQLHWLGRIAPQFITAQLDKGSKTMLPPTEPR
ncbi:MAG TPA: SDR family NAD(P)-dependent oxidoreductase [Polyangiaceae bacterium]